MNRIGYSHVSATLTPIDALLLNAIDGKQDKVDHKQFYWFVNNAPKITSMTTHQRTGHPDRNR